MSEQEKNEQALKQLGIEIPEGWEFVRYGVPLKAEFAINIMGFPSEVFNDNCETKWLVVKKKIETECWYLVEGAHEYELVMYLSENKKWQLSPITDPNRGDSFSSYKIISKMVVEK